MRLAFPDEPVGPSRAIGAIIGLAGVAVIIGPKALAGVSDQLNGAGITLVAAASYAAGAVATRKNGMWREARYLWRSCHLMKIW